MHFKILLCPFWCFTDQSNIEMCKLIHIFGYTKMHPTSYLNLISENTVMILHTAGGLNSIRASVKTMNNMSWPCVHLCVFPVKLDRPWPDLCPVCLHAYSQRTEIAAILLTVRNYSVVVWHNNSFTAQIRFWVSTPLFFSPSDPLKWIGMLTASFFQVLLNSHFIILTISTGGHRLRRSYTSQLTPDPTINIQRLHMTLNGALTASDNSLQITLWTDRQCPKRCYWTNCFVGSVGNQYEVPNKETLLQLQAGTMKERQVEVSPGMPIRKSSAAMLKMVMGWLTGL